MRAAKGSRMRPLPHHAAFHGAPVRQHGQRLAFQMVESVHVVDRFFPVEAQTAIHKKSFLHRIAVLPLGGQTFQTVAGAAVRIPAADHQQQFVAVRAGDAAYGQHLSGRGMAAPAPDVVLLEIGQGQQQAVVAHDPEHGSRRLLVGPLTQAVPFEQMRRQDGKVIARIAVFFPANRTGRAHGRRGAAHAGWHCR